MRLPAILIAVALLAIVPPPARSTGALSVDAGTSQVAYDGGPLTLAASVAGGTPPYAYAWSLAGDASRFSDPAAATTTLDTAGLSGAFVVTLEVTDADANVATDTVRHATAASTVRVSATVATGPGVPDERVAGTQVERKIFAVTVPTGTARVAATLSWPDAGSDLDLDLTGPAAATSGDQGRTSSNPERVSIDAPPAGGWLAAVKPVFTTGTTATLVARTYPAGPFPRGAISGDLHVGRLDAQALTASATGGAAPYTFAWDADGDGVHEAPGASLSLSRPTGAHVIALKTTDANGYETRATTTLTVADADRALPYICGGAPGRLWAMEFTATRNTCWVHSGHHTYFLGATYAFRGVKGIGFAVEQMFSPPADPEGFLAHEERSRVLAEVSADGVNWTHVGDAPYVLTTDRQYVRFDLAGAGEPTRFVRFASPPSAAQGLSGYLDHSEGKILVDVVAQPPAPALAAGARTLTCERDLLEDFFATHPCWFGGIERYDSPSLYHTYYLGGQGSLDRVTGSFLLAPFRTDDWNQGDVLTNATTVAAYVQTSADGVNWTTHATVRTVFGAPTSFDVALGGSAAKFVRLFPEYHKRFDQTVCCASNHHPKGYFLDSRVTVEGLLPAIT